ncbi:MAG: J domain-containing protein [Candidatus Sumerlaeia bacterium]
MSVQYKDYYKILGLERGATGDEIKKAYRKLAAKYHPDRHAGSKQMEEKFKEINEANEVLGDPKKREAYDRLGSNWRQGQSINPEDLGDIFGQFMGGGAARGARGGAQPGGATFTFNTGGGGFSDFFETLFGGGGPFGGRGGMGAQGPAGFENLFGGGERTFGQGHRAGGNVETELNVSLEDAFAGTTRTLALKGSTGASQTYDVKIPAGIRDGQKIRLRGQGKAFGAGGDLLITIHVAPHPRYTLEGDDLTMELSLAPWEAMLGATITVQTLGGPVQVKVPAGIDSGKRLRVRGRGWPLKGGARGDLFLRVSIKVPTSLTEQERDLVERLGRVSQFNPRG